MIPIGSSTLCAAVIGHVNKMADTKIRVGHVCGIVTERGSLTTQKGSQVLQLAAIGKLVPGLQPHTSMQPRLHT